MVTIHEVLQKYSVGHPVFYEDQVNILSAQNRRKLTSAWSAEARVTPGQNEKDYPAGSSPVQRNRKSQLQRGSCKNSALFISLLEHLKATYRPAKIITLIVENDIIHNSQHTLKWLQQNPKFRVIYQPLYSPWVNHAERLWQALHDTITRNYQCRSIRCDSC